MNTETNLWADSRYSGLSPGGETPEDEDEDEGTNDEVPAAAATAVADRQNGNCCERGGRL